MGPMYSGKTTKLFKSFLDNNHDEKLVIDYDIDDNTECITSHDGCKLPCVKRKTLGDFMPRQRYIYINEAQFFPDLVPFVLHQLQLGKTLEIYGLDGDFRQNKIGHIADLIPYSDKIEKLNGTCSICEKPSIFTKRITEETEQIVFNEDSYKPVCRICIL
jgi:thymidine kinase